MKARPRFLTPEMAFFCIFLLPAPLSSQRPQPPGKLSVTSTPPGAQITIDKQPMSQLTDATFVVSPGGHDVVVKGKGDTLTKCANSSVQVESGRVTSIHCTSAGFDTPVVN